VVTKVATNHSFHKAVKVLKTTTHSFPMLPSILRQNQENYGPYHNSIHSVAGREKRFGNENKYDK